MWIFDLPDDGGRLLRLREGHSSQPSKIQFYGSNGKHILSAGTKVLYTYLSHFLIIFYCKSKFIYLFVCFLRFGLNLKVIFNRSG